MGILQNVISKSESVLRVKLTTKTGSRRRDRPPHPAGGAIVAEVTRSEVLPPEAAAASRDASSGPGRMPETAERPTCTGHASRRLAGHVQRPRSPASDNCSYDCSSPST